MNTTISIKSRYSVQPINSNFYAPINVSGSTSIGQKGLTQLESGYIFAPYIMAESVSFYNEEDLIKEKNELRQKKLDSL